MRCHGGDLDQQKAFVSKVHASLQQGHIVLVQGETGCGKSVRLPRLLMEMGMSPILCAQPRRLAARSIAHRVAEELGQPLGQRVGYQIGQRRVATAQTELLFVTASLAENETLAPRPSTADRIGSKLSLSIAELVASDVDVVGLASDM